MLQIYKCYKYKYKQRHSFLKKCYKPIWFTIFMLDDNAWATCAENHIFKGFEGVIVFSIILGSKSYRFDEFGEIPKNACDNSDSFTILVHEPGPRYCFVLLLTLNFVFKKKIQILFSIHFSHQTSTVDIEKDGTFFAFPSLYIVLV